MRAAIYARYSSENQRRESIEDQVTSCRKLAAERGYVVADEHVFADHAASGAREDLSFAKMIDVGLGTLEWPLRLATSGTQGAT